MADDPIPIAPRRRAAPRCPICGKPPSSEHRPFCSRRCRQVDLARWFSGAYRIEAESSHADDEPGEREPH